MELGTDTYKKKFKRNEYGQKNEKERIEIVKYTDTTGEERQNGERVGCRRQWRIYGGGGV